ncbi:MAG: Sapep family Mn(2+)-dependent dipeptidase, partial [Oscillibacter sp.]
ILDQDPDERAENLQKIVRFKSISGERDGDAPYGRAVQDALDFALSLANAKGFDTVNFDNYAAEINFGDQEKSVGVMCHLDVVPSGDGWTYPPFAGEMHNGKIYGRGTTDNKGPFIAAFYACLALKESGIKLSKKVKHVVGTSEEKGDFPDIAYYLEHAEVPERGIIPDSWFPAVFAEKGILSYSFLQEFPSVPPDGDIVLLSAGGGEAFNVVSPYARAEFQVTPAGKEQLSQALRPFEAVNWLDVTYGEDRVCLTATGKSAHASTPEVGRNAIALLLQALNCVDYAPRALRDTLGVYCRQVGNDSDGSGLGIDSSDISGALTNNLGIFTYEKNHLALRMNIRSPISVPLEELEEKLKLQAAVSGSSYEKWFASKHYYVDQADDTLQSLLGVYREMTGECKTMPKAHGGGSYARILSNFVPFGPAFQDEELMFHMQDENIDCERLLLLSKIYAQALYALAK